MISSLFLQLVVTVWIGAHPLTYTLPRIYRALQADSCVAKGQWLLAHAKPGLEMEIYCVGTDKREA
jgi:hypothetical protein